jgi:hypothetical protein
VIALPPVDAGAVHETATEFWPPVAVTPVGAPATVRAAVVVAVAVPAVEEPTAF